MGNLTSIKLTESRSLAEEALAAADIQSLKKLFDEKCDDVQSMVAGMSVIIEAGTTSPRPSDNGVLAIRDVALAAIQLASDVATENALIYQTKPYPKGSDDD